MKKLITLLFVGAAFLSCTDDDIKTEQNLAAGDKVVGFPSDVYPVPYFEDEGVILRKFPLDLIGTANGQYSATDIEVEYEIDYANSTATEGVEFNFVDTSGKIVIPAGSTFGEYPLEVNTGNLNPDYKTVLVLKLKSSSPGSTIGAQYDTLKITFVGCLSLLDGNYSVAITSAGLTAVRTNEVVTLTDINTFRTRYVGRYTLGTFSPAGYTFIDICDEISLPKNQTLGGYSNKVYGTSFYGDGIDGIVTSETTFEVVHNIAFADGDQKQTYLYTRL